MSVLARELDPTRMILDESGGWGEGANIYLPYERTPKKFNDIHHYSGSQVNEVEYKKQVEAVKEFVIEGGYAIFLEVPGIKLQVLFVGRELNEIETDVLPFGAELHSPWVTLGAWAAKSHIVTDHPVFNGLPTEIIMHGVYENVHPKISMSKQKGKYIAGMIGYDHFPNMDIMVRHYNGPGETWWAADVLEAPIGKGKMLLSTLDLLNNLGQDPVAEKILFNMIKFAVKQ